MNFFNAKLTEVAIRQMVSELTGLNDRIGQLEASVCQLLKRSQSTRKALASCINDYNQRLYQRFASHNRLADFSDYRIPASFLVDGYLVQNQGQQAMVTPAYSIHERTGRPGLECLRLSKPKPATQSL